MKLSPILLAVAAVGTASPLPDTPPVATMDTRSLSPTLAARDFTYIPMVGWYYSCSAGINISKENFTVKKDECHGLPGKSLTWEKVSVTASLCSSYTLYTDSTCKTAPLVITESKCYDISKYYSIRANC